MSVDHYENFPVASLLIPARQRPAVEAIYHFARGADDIADEGDAPPAVRLSGLTEYRAGLDRIAAGVAPEPSPLAPMFVRLAAAVAEHDLPLQPCYDLLDAFAQDVVKPRYADYAEVLDYCRRSADPVGRLMLHLFGCATPDNIARSDAICTALQLINFWQDIAIDWQKDRVYLPQDELQHFGLADRDIAAGRWTPEWAALLDFQIERTRRLMLQGAPLVHALPGRFGWEIRLTVQGGLRILEHLQRVRGDVFQRRPKLKSADWCILAARALVMRPDCPNKNNHETQR